MLLLIVVAFLMSATCARAQLPPISEEQLPFENMDVNIALELKSDGRCYFNVKIEGPSPSLPTLPRLGGSFDFDVSSPSSGLLAVATEGNVNLSEEILTDEFNMGLAAIIGMYTSMPDALNSILRQGIENALQQAKEAGQLLSNLADLTVQEARITKLQWDRPKLTAGLSITMRATLFENQKLRDELPLKIDGSLDISATAINLTIEFSSRKTNGDLGLTVTAQRMTFELDGSLELPKVGENVQFEIPETQAMIEPEQLEELRAILGKNDVTLSLKVPADAEVTGLPPGSTQADSTYTWSGEGAADAIASIATGQAKTGITYKYKPPAPSAPWVLVAIVAVIVAVAGAAVVVLRRR